jgi:hypothetical protein
MTVDGGGEKRLLYIFSSMAKVLVVCLSLHLDSPTCPQLALRSSEVGGQVNQASIHQLHPAQAAPSGVVVGADT